MRPFPTSAVHTILPVALLLGTLVLSGCQGEEEATAAAPSSTASDAGSAAGEPTPEAAADEEGEEGSAVSFTADTSADTAEASPDAQVTVRDIRIGRHEGFDRVVFELGGTGTPGWDVGYVDAATSQGSGDPVDVEGDAVLRMGITGAGYPYATGVEEYAGPDPLRVADTTVVTEVAFDATYEGTTVAFIGTKSSAPFRVYLLEAPTRVVVEVRNPV